METNKNLSSHSLQICFVLLLMLAFMPVHAGPRQYKIDSLYRKNGMQRIARDIRPNGWVHFNDKTKFDRSRFFNDNKKEFGLGKDDQLEEYQRNIEGDMEHVKYRQKYKGIPVESGMVIAHTRNGEIKSLNGKPILEINVDIKPTISSAHAVNIAIDKVHAEKYSWQEETNDVENTSYPEPELVILPKSEILGTDKDYLAFKVNIRAIKPVSDVLIYIDARSGKVLRSTNNTFHSNIDNVPRCFNDPASEAPETFTITVDNYTSSHLQEFRPNDLGNVQIDVYDETNSINLTPPLTGSSAFDALFGIEQSLDYYHNILGRHSLNDNNMTVTCSVVPGGNDWSDNTIHIDTFCGGCGIGIHLIGEEFSHGVVQYAVNNFINSGELLLTYHEGFANMFASCIQFYGLGAHDNLPSPYCIDNGNVLVGYENKNYWYSGSWSHPIQYKGYGWCFDANSYNPCRSCKETFEATRYNWGHCRARVLLHWFFLLTMGAQSSYWYFPWGTAEPPQVADTWNYDANEYQLALSEQTLLGSSKLGILKAEKLAYKVLANYLTDGPSMTDIADCSIEAAIDGGYSIDDINTIINAWKAVNVVSSNYITGATISGDVTNSCYINRTLTTNGETHVHNGISSEFIFGDKINLKTGFRAYTGSNLRTHRINDKPNSGWNKSAIVLTENNSEIASSQQNTKKTKIDDGNINVESILLYPNPTNGQLILESRNNSIKSLEVTIIDLSGKQIYACKSNQSRMDIDISKASAGIYYIKVITDKKAFTKKIIKQ